VVNYCKLTFSLLFSYFVHCLTLACIFVLTQFLILLVNIVAIIGNCSPRVNSTSGGGGCGKKQSNGSGNGSSRHVTSRGGKSTTKTTRIRTVLNEKQLHTLRTCYAANPRPDALMKDQLVEMTGLSSRVIRVWFQNKRCKDKKRTILIKQLQQQHQDKVTSWHLFTLQWL